MRDFSRSLAHPFLNFANSLKKVQKSLQNVEKKLGFLGRIIYNVI